MDHPLVSVIIPTYNYGRYILEAIESVLNQSYPLSQIEIIVFDDGSTDDTHDILLELINNGTVQYYYQKNKGKASATFQAVKKCSGKYIFNLDADDYFLKDKIAAYVDVFESDEAIVHVAAPNKFLYQNTSAFEVEKIPPALLSNAIDGNTLLLYFYKNNIIFGGGSTYAARASVLKKIKIPQEVDMFIDEFLLVAVFPYGKSYFLNEPFSIWRVHTSNFSSRQLSTEKLIINESRLLKSSHALLKYMVDSEANPELVRIYKVMNSVRKISYKESLGTKTLLDIFHFGVDIFIVIRPAWHIVKKYNVINRFAPSSLAPFMKKMKYKFSPKVVN